MTTLEQLKLSDLIMTDKTKVKLAMIRQCIRKIKGKRAYVKYPNN
ncbi:hypothetical protein [cyanobacterium endosymbiont of Epithemia turgida]|nr:hypothetical protein [cyanobacterium endosymbiont of Epithemia turgida]